MKKRIIKVDCLKCGRLVVDDFRSKWRHMIRYHPDEMARRILPLVFLPAEDLKQIGVDLAHSFIRRLKNG